jgi:hypothetical protein
LAHNVNKLIDADKKGYENLNAWQLRSHAIALAATKQNMPRLRGVVEQMSNQGLEKDSCCQKHIRCFGDPEVKAMFSSLFEE